MGLGIPTNKIDWFLYASSSELYSHEEHINWRMQEEQSMNLHCLGSGKIDKERTFLRTQIESDLVFGIFAGEICLRKKLRTFWQNRNLTESTMLTDELLKEIIEARSDIEMSVFVYLNNDLSQADLQTKYGSLLWSALGDKIKWSERQSLEEIVTWINPESQAKDKILSRDSKIKRGTKLILTTTSEGGLTLEAISPGPWSCASCHTMGTTKKTEASEFLFRLLLGKKPISEACKKKVVTSAIFLAKGGTFPKSHLESSIPFRHLNDWIRPEAPQNPQQKSIDVSLTMDMFSLQKPSTPITENTISVKLLSELKRDNRRRVNFAFCEDDKQNENSSKTLLNKRYFP
jgi:hypothetical protein